MKTTLLKLWLAGLVLAGCSHRNPTTVTENTTEAPAECETATTEEPDASAQTEEDEEDHAIYNRKSPFRITYNNNRPIHGFRVHCEGTQYFSAADTNNMLTYFNLVFTNAKTGKVFKMPRDMFFAPSDCDTLLPPKMSLTYKEGQTHSDGDDIFWFVDLDFDGQVELLSGGVFLNYPGCKDDYFRKIHRIVNGELVDATQEFIAKNRLFIDEAYRYFLSVNSKRRAISIERGTWAYWERLIYTYEKDGTYRYDRSICVDGTGGIWKINVISSQKDTLRHYEFSWEEFTPKREKMDDDFIYNL